MKTKQESEIFYSRLELDHFSKKHRKTGISDSTCGQNEVISVSLLRSAHLSLLKGDSVSHFESQQIKLRVLP